jgi:hypothetical protein
MSSPLKAFRKHQKKLIVIFGVLLMVSFTVLASVQQYLTPGSPGQQAGEEVIATWKHGEITRREVQDLRVHQAAAEQFMEMLAQEATKNGGSSQVEVLRGDVSVRGLAQQMILARKAEEMGVVITEDTITQYLAKLTDDTKRSPEQFEAMFEQLLKDRQTNYKGFLRYMREALLARNMLIMGTAGLSALSPGQAKSYHDRIYRHKKVELLPLKVEDYLAKVTGQPSDSELDKIYEVGEDRYSTPPSAEPGFRRRHMIQFAYFKGDTDKFRELEEAKITDEQIAKYYEEHKEDFKRASLSDDFGSGSTGDSDLPGTTIKPIGLPKLDLSTPSKKDSETDKKNDDPKGTSNDDASGEASPKDDPKDKSTEEDSKEKGSESSDDQSRIDARFNEPTLFVSLDDEAADDKGTEEEKSIADEDSEEEKSSPDKTVDDAKPAAPKTEVPPEKGGEKVESKEPDEGAGTGSSETEKEEPKSEYKSLDEMKDQIRSTLAKEAVTKEFEKLSSFSPARPFQFLRDRALNKASSQVRSYYRERNRWVARKEDSDVKKPHMPDWSAIAAEHNLEYGDTPLVDQVKVAETEIGKVTHQAAFVFNGQIQQMITRTFAEVAFEPEERLFNASEFPPVKNPNPQSVFFLNRDSARYLYWKASEREEYTPKFSKIRGEVVTAWRTQQARKLALADAKKKISEVEGSGKSLADVFGEEVVLEPRGFSWLSLGRGNVAFGGGQLDISEVEGVENPGEKFHQDISLLEQGEVGVATNQDESVVYVVQVERDSVENEFTTVGSEVNQLAGRDRSIIFRDWMDDIEREFDVEWQDSTN